MNLSTFRDAVVDYFSSEFSGLNVSAHGGEFGLDDVLRYAKNDPALIIAVIKADTDKTPMSGLLFNVRMSAVVLVRSRGDEAKDERSLRIGTFVMREIAKPGQFWDLEDTNNIKAPLRVSGENLFSTKLDKQGISLFGISWEQIIDLTADTAETYDDFETFYAEYDLGPDPDGEIEATDTVDLT